ncbi:hypothetical protein BDQ17DRAFT_1364945 [Cyathus striatus]|nr:hypothetical protein BDQ17DRAFT_1364945 [Cyathus striatus]
MPPKGAAKKKAPASDGTATPHIPSLAEQMSYLQDPRPFKNPNYTKNINRRTKNLKTVLSQERERERSERERRRLEKLEGATNSDSTSNKDEMEVDGEEKVQPSLLPSAAVNGAVIEEDMPTYSSIEVPPSVLPQKRYCDITGLEAPYTDPATGLRYHDKSVYELIKGLSVSTAKEYLSARGVNSIVK